MLNVKTFIATLVLFYIVILLLVYLFQEKLIFFPRHLRDNYAFDLTDQDQEVTIWCEDSTKINGILFKKSGPKVILYFHGNAGDLRDWQYVSHDFKMLNHSLLVIDFRGYGKSGGTLSEKGLYDDAQSSYDHLLNLGYKPRDIIVYGRSIGSGLAVHLASTNKIGALVLESPFSSFEKIAKEKMPFLMPWLTLRYRFKNIDKIKQVVAPILLMHGDQDELIPSSHSTELYNNFEGQKDMIIINGGGHNDLSTYPQFQAGLLQFLEQN